MKLRPVHFLVATFLFLFGAILVFGLIVVGVFDASKVIYLILFLLFSLAASILGN